MKEIKGELKDITQEKLLRPEIDDMALLIPFPKTE